VVPLDLGAAGVAEPAPELGVVEEPGDRLAQRRGVLGRDDQAGLVVPEIVPHDRAVAGDERGPRSLRLEHRRDAGALRAVREVGAAQRDHCDGCPPVEIAQVGVRDPLPHLDVRRHRDPLEVPAEDDEDDPCVERAHGLDERRVVAREIAADRDHEALARLLRRREEPIVDAVQSDGHVRGVDPGQLEQLVALRRTEADDPEGLSQG
jgi:hypothetical protein